MEDRDNGSELDDKGLETPQDAWTSPTTRKSFLKGAAVAGAGATGLSALAPAVALAGGRHRHHRHEHHRHHRHEMPAPPSGPTPGDLEILGAAQIAEALAVTTYTNIINTAPFFKNLEDDDQGYLKAAVQEEMSHYLLEESVTGKPTPFTTFYYPPKMFTDAQTTLEHPGHARGRVHRRLSGRRARLQHPGPAGHRGADHGHRVRPPHARARRGAGRRRARTAARSRQITGIQKVAESVDPPNNNGYERTLGLTNIGQAVEALLPFADKARPKKRASTSRSRSRSCRSPRRCRARSANSTRSRADRPAREAPCFGRSRRAVRRGSPERVRALLT